MKKNIIVIILILLSSSFFLQTKADDYFLQKIDLPDLENGEYQPIDTYIAFDNPCRAINEELHSIRVFFNGNEIESQIYNLEFQSNEELKGCNIVFLYQGKGEYFAQYGEQIRKVSYQDHLDVKNGHYSLDFLPGLSVDIDYYGIWENNELVTAIGTEGHILAIPYGMGHKIFFFKDNTQEFQMEMWKQILSVSLFKDAENSAGSDEVLVGKEVLIDGNLMIKIALETASENNDLSTKALYSYYYSPITNHRIFATVTQTNENSWNGRASSSFVMLTKMRSQSISQLNYGEILPYLHITGINGIEEYELETNPEHKGNEWSIDDADNVHLAEPYWVSYDDNKETFAMLFTENDDLNIKATLKEEVDFPGLEVDGGGISVGRTGLIKKGVVFEGTIEVFNGDYNTINEEQEAFKKLISVRNLSFHGDVKTIGKSYNLTIKTHLKNSNPLLVFLSKFTGIPLPSLQVEIWQNSLVKNEFIPYKRIKIELPEGNYVVKIYQQCLFNRKLIAIAPINLKSDMIKHMMCTNQGLLDISAPYGTTVYVMKKGVIEKIFVKSDDPKIPLPLFNTYEIKIYHSGFLIEEEEILLLRNARRNYDFDTYSFAVYFRDSLGLPLNVNLTPILTSKSMADRINILPSTKVNSEYTFNNIPSAQYELMVKYKNFTINQPLLIPEENNVEITLPIEYSIDIKTLDNRGFPIKTQKKLFRDGIDIEKKQVPPANYMVEITANKKVIAEIPISVRNDMSLEIITKKTSWYPFIIPVLIGIMFLLKRKFEIFIGFIISLSLYFPWWQLKSQTNTNLYLFFPKIIEICHENEYYGTVNNLPEELNIIFYLIMLLTMLGIALLFSAKMKKFSTMILMLVVVLFIISLIIFGDITVGSIWGSGQINGVYSTWGFGTGFYIIVTALSVQVIQQLFNLKNAGWKKYHITALFRKLRFSVHRKIKD